MKTKLNTLEEVQAFIDNVNAIMGYPNEANGTLTYCHIPDITEVKDENGLVIESYYEIEVTTELQEEMVKIATQKLIGNETVNQ